jgi:hypothetical protein
MRSRYQNLLITTVAVLGIVAGAPLSAHAAARVTLCEVPSATELTAAGVTTPCTEKHLRKSFSGGRSSELYAASWFAVGQIAKPQLTVVVDKDYGPKRALAGVEFDVLHSGLFGIGHHVAVGRHAYVLHFGKELTALWARPSAGHIYVGEIDLRAQPAAGIAEPDNTAVTTAIGKAVVAAFK